MRRRIGKRRAPVLSRRGRALALAVLATGLAAPTASADPVPSGTPGLYSDGESIAAAYPPATASKETATGWRIHIPAGYVGVGNLWEMNWGCAVAGSEIAAVIFGAVRANDPSSLAVGVTTDRRPFWWYPDYQLGAPMAFDVRLPPRECNVHLILAQIEGRTQHNRTYFIEAPRILIRDLTPPSLEITDLTPGWITGAQAAVRWSINDNFGSAGMGTQRIVAGGHELWRGVPGQGAHAVGVKVGGLGDGVHEVQVQVDGNGTPGAVAQGVIRIDRSPPTVSNLATAPFPVPGQVGFQWTVDDATSGPGEAFVQINAAPDGSDTGAWQSVASANSSGPQAMVTTPRLLGVPDGLHAWRVVTHDGAGNVTVQGGRGLAHLDTTPPDLTIHSLTGQWTRRPEVDFTATDNFQGLVGLGAIEVDANTATDGGASGRWVPLARLRRPPGRYIEPIDLAGLGDGRHLLQIRVRNGGPLGDYLATEKIAVVRVDQTAPEISGAFFSRGPQPGQLRVAWAADDALSGVAAAAIQWRHGDSWRTLAITETRPGSTSVVVDASTLPAGPRQLRLVIGDIAGNVAVREGRLTLQEGGAGSTSKDPLARLRGARLQITVPRAATIRAKGRTILSRRIATGQAIPVAARLRDQAGRPIVGAEVQARGFGNRVIGRALSDRRGIARIVLRPNAGGLVRFGVPVAGRLLPSRSQPELRLSTSARVSLSVVGSVAASGRRLLFSGRIRPAPGQLGLPHKGVVLEWVDPVRGTWRPVVNARVKRDGTFNIPWRFNIRGLTIPMRVSVPEELGWPLLRARSRTIRVALR